MNIGLCMIITVAGGLGSAMRYLVDCWIRERVAQRLPWSTFLINFTGSLVLGLLTGFAGSSAAPWVTVAGVGLLGGYTTLSTASVETVRLMLDHRLTLAAWYAVGGVAACVLAATIGLLIGDAVHASF